MTRRTGFESHEQLHSTICPALEATMRSITMGDVSGGRTSITCLAAAAPLVRMKPFFPHDRSLRLESKTKAAPPQMFSIASRKADSAISHARPSLPTSPEMSRSDPLRLHFTYIYDAKARRTMIPIVV